MFRLLMHYLGYHKRQLAIGTLVVLLSNLVVLLPPYFIGRAIDALRTGQSGAVIDLGFWQLGTAGPISSLLLLEYGLAVVLSALVAALLTLTVRRQLIVASRQIDYEIRRDLFSHLSHLDKHYYDRARTGDLMNRMTGDLTAVREMLGFAFWQVLNVVTGFTASFVVLFGISSVLAALVLAIMPLMIGFLALLSRAMARRYVAVQEQNSTISAKAQENFSGVRVVKGYALESREVGEYQTLNRELIRRSLRLTQLEGPIWGVMSLLMGIAYLLILVVGGRMILGLSSQSLTLGSFTQFALTFERLAWPMLSIGFIFNTVQRGYSSWARLFEMFAARSQMVEKTQLESQSSSGPAGSSTGSDPVRGDLEFRNVTVQFGDTPVLENISLKVAAGTTLGITGPTGSGKTLLGQMISRLFDPTSGQILLDGRDLRHYNLQDLRSSVAVVPQEPFLFSETIAQNIAFGIGHDLPEVETTRGVLESPPSSVSEARPDLEQVKKAAALAGLAGDIEDFPGGYDTLLGERGVTLSGGQRQRTALARAIAKDAPVLILDDALSAVDTETEARILSGLRQLEGDKTLLLIGHRVSTLRHADHIVVLKDGQILEQGSHEALIALGGHYADLERKQSLAQSLEEDALEGTEKTEKEVRPGVSSD